MAAALSRPKRGRMIGGVCAGLGRRFGLAPTVVRAIFLISCLLPGPQVLIYLACWILIPQDEYA
ncbi:MAG: PspC domain-containing protein [Propionibacteriaceae bacterium]